MKKKLVFSAMLVCLLALGFALAGCSSDDDGGGTIDTAKLKGTWVKDGDPSYQLIFGSYDEYMGISLGHTGGGHNGGGSTDINGDVIGNDEDSFKVAFDGEKLVVSEGKGDFATYNGTYTKQ
jgi:hypothetical protein